MSAGPSSAEPEGQEKKPTEDLEYEIKVEHCIFSWTVENFPCQKWKESVYLCSPQFAIRSSLFSTWTVNLKRCVYEGGDKGIEFLIHRLEHLCGVNLASVTFRLGLENSTGNKVWFQEVKEAVFGNPDSRIVRSSLLEHLEDFCDGPLTVLCEMYASASKEGHFSDPFLKDEYFVNLLHLSLDMTKMYANQTLYNVLLKVIDKEYRVHRSVLSARSTSIARLLENENSYIEFQALHSGIMDCLLHYVYSGSINLTLANSELRIGLYEAAHSLGISSFIKHLVPNLITAKTSMDTEHCDFVWFIEHFSLRPEKIIISPEFNFNLDHTDSWRVILYNQSHATHIGISMKPREQRGTIPISLKVSLLDKNGTPWVTRYSEVLFRPGDAWTLPTLVEKRALRDSEDALLPQDVLSLHCSLSFRNAKSNAIRSSFILLSICGELSNLQRLSDDIFSLFETGHLSNIDLFANETRFPAHKEILAARSKISTARVQVLKSAQLPEVSPHILRLLLTYIYKGLPEFPNRDIAMNLYKAAARNFGMPLFQQQIVNYLKHTLEIPGVLDVYCFGRYFFEHSLKSTCLEYIYIHSEDVFEHEEWRNLENYNPEIAREILSSIEQNYSR